MGGVIEIIKYDVLWSIAQYVSWVLNSSFISGDPINDSSLLFYVLL